MSKSRPLTAVCTYRVKPGKEKELLRLLGKQWEVLRGNGLVTGDRPIRLQGVPLPANHFRPKTDRRTIIEILSWRSERASKLAHRHPEVLSIWEPMVQCCESMAFPNFVVLDTSSEA